MKRLGLIISLFFLLLTLPHSARGACVAPIGPAFDTCPPQNPKYCYVRNDYTGSDLTCCQNQQQCDERQPTGETHDFTGTGTCLPGTPGGCLPQGSSGQASSFSPQGDCGSETEVDTAIGCIPTNFGGLFGKFFTLGIGIAGGIAFLLILFGGFQILTSAGNPEQLAAGKELVTSAITGLLMIIFSVLLLQIIGVDILCIPGFGSC